MQPREVRPVSDGPAPGASGERRRTSFLKTAAGTFGTNVAVSILSLVNVLIVARVLGPSGRGDVAFLIAIATLAAFFGALGIQEANGNLAGADAAIRPSLATNSILFAFLFGAIVAVAIAVLVATFPAMGGDVSRGMLWATLAVIPAIIIKGYLNYLVQAGYRFAITNLTWLAGPLTTAVTNSALALTGHLTVWSAIAAWIAGQLFGATLLVVYVGREIGFGRPNLHLARRATGFGWKVHVGQTLAIGNYRLDQWFVGAFNGSTELGLYSVAVAWAEVLFYLPGVLVMVQRPDLVRADSRTAAALAQRVLRITLLLAVGMAIILVVAAPFLCTVVFGPEFAGSVPDLRVLAGGAIGICLMTLLGSALNAQQRPLLTTYASACAFVLTIGLDLLLIPPHGGLGASIATTAAWTGGGIVIAVLFSRAMRTSVTGLIPRGSDMRWIHSELRARLDARRA